MAILTNKSVQQTRNILLQALLPDLNKETGESKYFKNWFKDKSAFHATAMLHCGYQLIVRCRRDAVHKTPIYVFVNLNGRDKFRFHISDSEIVFRETIKHEKDGDIDPYRKLFVMQMFYDVFGVKNASFEIEGDEFIARSNEVDFMEWTFLKKYEQVDCEVQYRLSRPCDGLAFVRNEHWV